jgi:hypothetical protein
MFLAWFDPDKRRPAHLKLEDAVAVYREKFMDEPVLCLVNEIEAAELASHAGDVGLPVKEAHYIARNTFYVGDFDPQQDLEDYSSTRAA